MRLIDVTDLEKFIQENVCAIGDDHLLLFAGDDGRWHEALPLVKTAYDVDKVVEELEKLIIMVEQAGCIGQCESSECIICGILKAIKIVKQGGVGKDVEQMRAEVKRNGE